jgi:hypothetical protein
LPEPILTTEVECSTVAAFKWKSNRNKSVFEDY